MNINEAWNKYKKTGYKRYRDILVINYFPLVKMIALKLKRNLPACVDIDDLISSGVIGLVNTIDSFDITRGVKFETYCSNRVRGAMLDELRALDWVPTLVRRKGRKIEKTYTEAGRKLNRLPNHLEVAKTMKISMREFQEMEHEVSIQTIFSFNRETVKSETDFFELIDDSNGSEPLHGVIIRDIADYIKRSLTDREKKVLQMRLHLNLSTKEIGKMMNVTQGQISHIYMDAIRRLQNQFGRRQSEWLA